MTYPHTFNSKRLQANGLTESFQTFLEGVPCFLQPLGDREVAELNQSYSQPHKCLTDITTNVQVGDELEILGETFRVRGVKDFKFGMNPHKRLALERLGSITSSFEASSS
jgi:hypothetical protein